MQKFCPRCGKDVENVFGPHGLCKNCFSKSEDFVELPEELVFQQCSVCGDYQVAGKWKEFETDYGLVYDLLKPYEEDDVDMSASFRRQGEKYIVNVLMEQEINAERVEQTHEMILKPEKTQCKKCSRHHGGYYTIILQLRGNLTEDMFGRLMDKAADTTNKDRNAFISNIEELKEGYDLYLSNRKMANALLNLLRESFELEEKRSKEIVGETDGQQVYRTVISAHIGRQLHTGQE